MKADDKDAGTLDKTYPQLAAVPVVRFEDPDQGGPVGIGALLAAEAIRSGKLMYLLSTATRTRRRRLSSSALVGWSGTTNIIYAHEGCLSTASSVLARATAGARR